MKFSPLEIQQVNFKTSFRGYDKREVDSFLQSVAEDLEIIIKENNRYKEKIGEMESEISELRKRESLINSTLIKAEEITEEIKKNTQKESVLIIKEAEINAQKIINSSKEGLIKINKEIEDLKREKVILVERVGSIIRSFQKIIEMEDEESLK